MKIKPEGWNLNLVGSWNPAILNPNWLSKNVFHVDTVTIEMGLLQPGGVQVSLTENNVNLLPYKDRVMLRPLNFNDDTLDLCDKYARALLTLLPHTPVAGIGVNMSFSIIKDYPDKIIFLFEDDDKLDFSNYNTTILQKIYTRKLSISEIAPVELNLKVIYDNISLDDEVIVIEFNYHHPHRKYYDELLGKNGGFKRYREFSLDFLNKIYNLELEG